MVIASSRRMSVPLVDLRAQYADLQHEILPVLQEVAASGTYALGPKVRDFEEAFAAHVGVKHCVGVNTGTSALHLALVAAGVGPGDEVITVPMTFIATTWAISYVGATPVFVDVDPGRYTMNPAQVEAKITVRTRAILPVHLYGQPADLAPLLEISRRKGIPLIEDACQAHGARYQGQGVGGLGLCGCFSFYPGKNLGAYGEGGAITTNDDAIARRLRALRDHAQSIRYHHEEIGFNYRMDALQGAVLGVKLRRLSAWNRARARRAERYRNAMADLPAQLPSSFADSKHAWHLFVLLHPERDRLRMELEERGIAAGLHYPIPVHLQKPYAGLGYGPGSFPVAERIARECLTLPLFPEMTDAQQDWVIESVRTSILGGTA